MKKKGQAPETKAFDFEVKAFDPETGEIEGYAAVFGNVDHANDVVDRGAFTKTLQENGGQCPILWQHDANEPIGLCSEMREDGYGLFVKGQINLDVQRGREAVSLLKQKAMKGLSIGYSTIKAAYEGGARHLKELRLWEWSPVTFPCNTLAGVTAVKAADFNAILQAAQNREALWQARYQIDDALRSVIHELMEASSDGDEEGDGMGMSDAERLATLANSIDQYKAALLDWFAQWLTVIGTDAKGEAGPDATKAGKTLSAATLKKLTDAHDCAMQAVGHIKALIGEPQPADDATDDAEEAAKKAGEPDLTTLRALNSEMKMESVK